MTIVGKKHTHEGKEKKSTNCCSRMLVCSLLTIRAWRVPGRHLPPNPTRPTCGRNKKTQRQTFFYQSLVLLCLMDHFARVILVSTEILYFSWQKDNSLKRRKHGAATRSTRRGSNSSSKVALVFLASIVVFAFCFVMFRSPLLSHKKYKHHP